MPSEGAIHHINLMLDSRYLDWRAEPFMSEKIDRDIFPCHSPR